MLGDNHRHGHGAETVDAVDTLIQISPLKISTSTEVTLGLCVHCGQFNDLSAAPPHPNGLFAMLGSVPR